MRKLAYIIALLLLSVPCFAAPKNVIIMIGDGMGFEQVKAAGIYETGREDGLSFYALPVKGSASTYSASSDVTDSAAAGTAIATGHKVNNGVISEALPGDGERYTTMLEYFKSKGKATGLVTTSYLTDATPAAFGAHAENRNDTGGIAAWYFDRTRPDVLLGGGKGLDREEAEKAGYAVVEDAAGLKAVNAKKSGPVAGIFGGGYLPYEYDGVGAMPHLSDMASKALELLARDPDGLFVLIEGGNIDHAGHDHNLERNIAETVEFSYTVKMVYDWAKKHPGTLLIITADHETGGLKVTADNGKGNYPGVSWTANGHSGADVPVFAYGEGASALSKKVDDTEFYGVVTGSR